MPDYAALYEALLAHFGPDGDLNTRAEDAGLDALKGIWDQPERIAAYPGVALTVERFVVEPGALRGCAQVRPRFLIHYRDQAKDERSATLTLLTMAQVLVESAEAYPGATLTGDVDFLRDDRDPLLRAVVVELDVRE